MRKTARIACLIIAGFCVYGVGLLSFTVLEPWVAKYAMMVTFTVPAAGFLATGLLLGPREGRMRALGIVLLSGAGVAAFAVLSLICMVLSPETEEIFPDNKLDSASDYVTGAIVLAVLAGSGALLIRAGGRPTDQPEDDPGSSG